VFLVLALLAMVVPVAMSHLRFRGQRIQIEQDEC
jgi:hypothetical protein